MGKQMTFAEEEIGLMRGRNFGWKAFWGSNPERLCFKLTLEYVRVKFSLLSGKSAGRAPPVRVVPWHLAYN